MLMKKILRYINIKLSFLELQWFLNSYTSKYILNASRVLNIIAIRSLPSRHLKLFIDITLVNQFAILILA